MWRFLVHTQFAVAVLTLYADGRQRRQYSCGIRLRLRKTDGISNTEEGDLSIMKQFIILVAIVGTISLMSGCGKTGGLDTNNPAVKKIFDL